MVSRARYRLASAAVVAASLMTLAAPAPAFVWPNVPERVARGLESTDPAERRAAAQDVADLPIELAKPLARKAMADEDNEVRIAAAKTAVKLRLSGAGDLVVPWLSETDSRLRLAACEVVRAVPTSRGVTALGRVLSDPSEDVRLTAAAAMGRSGSAEAASLLLGHLDDTSPEVRGEVVQSLGRLGDRRAVLPLVGRVQDASIDVRRRVARALGELGDPRAASALVLALNDSSLEVRVEAATALGRLGSDEAALALAPLARGAGAEDPARSAPGSESVHALRQAALRALGRVGSPRAIDLLVAALEQDRPEALRSPAREALTAVGPRAVKPLVTLLGGSPSPRVATGAVQALGAIGDKSAVPAITRGMQRGIVPLTAGLGALADLRSDEALPAVLELIGDQPPDVRRAAIRAATELLDPARPDGRAVDPVREALRDPTLPLEERALLIALLGRTGSPRAAAVLLGLGEQKPIALRRAVLGALGSLHRASPKPGELLSDSPGKPGERAAADKGDAAIDAALVLGLDDENANVRMDAAIALSRVGSGALAPALLDRLAKSAEQDRGALGVAISGVLSRSREPEIAARAGAMVLAAPAPARDALIEGLGRMGTRDALTALTERAAGPADDRRKVAEALAAHGVAAMKPLALLAKDADASVRASAAWSIGFAGDAPAITILEALAGDADVTVAGNAVVSLGRVAKRIGDPALAVKRRCAALSDARANVRANALASLDLAGSDCGEELPSELLSNDPSEIVRIAAARHLHRLLARSATVPAPAVPAVPAPAAPTTGAPAAPADANASAPVTPERAGVRALARCAAEEPTYRVAQACERAPTHAPATGPFPLVVYVIPDGAPAPVPRTPFTLVLPDGTLRLGLADRRGAVFEAFAPPGEVELGVPAPLTF